MSDWAAGPRQLQYKWTFSDAGDQPTQSVVASSSGNITVTPAQIDLVNLKSSGSGWVQLTVTYPVNYASPRINWFLTCPTLGNLSSGGTSGSNAGSMGGANGSISGGNGSASGSPGGVPNRP